MRLRIVSDGTSHGTKVTDENGVVVENIEEITWQSDRALGLVMARLILKQVEADIVVNEDMEH